MRVRQVLPVLALASTVVLSGLAGGAGPALADKGDQGRAAEARERVREEAKDLREQAREGAKQTRDRVREEAKDLRERVLEEAKELRERLHEEAGEARERVREELKAAREEVKEATRAAADQGRRRAFQGTIVSVTLAQAAPTPTATPSATPSATPTTGSAAAAATLLGTVELRRANGDSVTVQVTSRTRIRVPGLQTLALGQLMAGDWVTVVTTREPASNGQPVARRVLVNPARSHIVRVNGVVLEPATQTRPPLTTLKVKSARLGEVTFGEGLATAKYVLPDDRQTVGKDDQVQVVARRIPVAPATPTPTPTPAAGSATTQSTTQSATAFRWIVLGVKVHEPDDDD